MKLQHFIRECQSGFACGTQDPGGVFQLRMNNVTADGHLDLTIRRRVPVDIAGKHEGLCLSAGDVVFNATNSLENVGKSAIIRELDEPTTFSNHFLRLRTHSNLLDPIFLNYWLGWQFRQGAFRGLAKRWVNQATVSRERLLSLELDAPPLPEQRRIASILDQADALRAKRRQVLAHLNALSQSIFDEMFPPDLQSVAMSSIGEELRLKSGAFLPASRMLGGRVPVYGGNGIAGWHDESNVDENTVIIGRVGANCGVVHVTHVPAWVTDNALVVEARKKPLDPLYLSAALKTLRLNRYSSRSGQPLISGGRLKDVPLPIPPLPLQVAFAERMRALGKIKRVAQQHDQALFDAQRAAQRLFFGPARRR